MTDSMPVVKKKSYLKNSPMVQILPTTPHDLNRFCQISTAPQTSKSISTVSDAKLESAAIDKGGKLIKSEYLNVNVVEEGGDIYGALVPYFGAVLDKFQEVE